LSSGPDTLDGPRTAVKVPGGLSVGCTGQDTVYRHGQEPVVDRASLEFGQVGTGMRAAYRARGAGASRPWHAE